MRTDEERLRYGTREEREEVFHRNPESWVRHLSWVTAGCHAYPDHQRGWKDEDQDEHSPPSRDLRCKPA